MKGPRQPLATDIHGVIRFRGNNVVRYLLDKGGIDLNDLAMMTFSDEDRCQFAQLIGYSQDGYNELGYVQRHEFGHLEPDEKVKMYERLLEDVRDGYDCDSDAHKYGTSCRACMARRALEGKDPWGSNE
jgi:hypothetical protein